MSPSIRHPAPVRELTRLAAVPLCLVLSLTLACSGGSSPVSPDGPLILEGVVEAQGRSEHDLVMPGDGLLDLRLIDVRPLLVDVTQVPASSINFGVGVGRRNEEGACRLTVNFILLEGDSNIFRLSRGEYCVSVFDPGFFPENALVGYTLEVEISA